MADQSPQLVCGGSNELGFFTWRSPCQIPDEHAEQLEKVATGFSRLLLLFLSERIERGHPGIAEKAFMKYTSEVLDGPTS